MPADFARAAAPTCQHAGMCEPTGRARRLQRPSMIAIRYLLDRVHRRSVTHAGALRWLNGFNRDYGRSNEIDRRSIAHRGRCLRWGGARRGVGMAVPHIERRAVSARVTALMVLLVTAGLVPQTARADALVVPPPAVSACQRSIGVSRANMPPRNTATPNKPITTPAGSMTMVAVMPSPTIAIANPRTIVAALPIVRARNDPSRSSV
jgi:hypothetical protein